jgi:hypothetical protein
MRFSCILFLSALLGEVAAQNATAPKASPVAASNASAAAPAPAVAPQAATPTAATAVPEEDNGTAAPTPYESTLSPTVAPFVMPPLQDCYTNLSDVFTLARFQDPFAKNVYNLCPNTVYDIGHLDAESYCCINGQKPLWPRKDTTYQCGEDGKSSNNCTFVNGATQVISFAPHWNFEKKSNTIIKGITFTDAKDMGILIMTDGEFLFEDCIFKVNDLLLSCL